MKPKKAIKILIHHNDWRRGDVYEHKYTPKQIGVAIDTVLNHIQNLERAVPDYVYKGFC